MRDTAEALAKRPMAVRTWRRLATGWSASLYPSSQTALDGGVAVQLSAACRVTHVMVGDSV